MQHSPHQPVLYQEIIHALEPRSPGLYVDGTVGAGGHARGILDACAPDGRLLGMDVDPQALALASRNLAEYGERVILRQASYVSVIEALRDAGWGAADGIVLDLGVSSMQLDTDERGFSFQREAPLDMRFDSGGGMTAADLLNTASETDLVDILVRYGEERHARRIARLIMAERPVTTTSQLAAIVMRAYRGHSRLHPATRTFQALRIAVNDELTCLEQGLPRAVEALQPHGRLAVIAFHSLEDRLVKQTFRDLSQEYINPPHEPIHAVERKAIVRPVNRRPIVPTKEEIARNPRARSAKLRVVEKLQP